MTKGFPDSFDFTGFNAPSRVEADVFDLVVEGNLPAEINGSWYRLTPDPQFPPMLGHDTYLSGDGMIGLFRFANGHVDLKQRWVHTERFLDERAQRRSLHGIYRNPYTDDPSVRGRGRGVANTTPVWHAGKLLALKEDSRAVEVDPHTLETLGEWDYDGKLRSETMTAHPHLDPSTNELYFFGYEAGGLATRDVAFCVADAEGRLVKEDWFHAPYVSFMHDFAITREHVVFPVFPTTCDLDRLKRGGPHWVWEPEKDTFVGIMPRDGSVKDMRWFRGPPCSAFHFMNAHTEGHRVHLDFGVASFSIFPFIRAASGVEEPTPEEMGAGRMVRWSFDLSRPSDKWEQYELGPGGDMPRIADKDFMTDYDIGYYQTFDPRVGPPMNVGPIGAGFNTICRLEVKSGRMKTWSPGPRITVQEHVHIPSETPGHEGYLAYVADLHDEFLSEIQVLEAGNIEKGPIARIKVPFRLRCQVHGNWVAAKDLPVARP